MKRLFLSFIVLCILASCSTKKKGFLNRAYHNTTARYNGYFNAREGIKQGLTDYYESREENFDEIIPIFPMPTEEDASSLYPVMNVAIEKTEKVISRHSMEIRGKEYCRWIDDNYLAKGMGHFYKREFKEAESTFNFIAKRYPEEDSKSRALGWLVRTHVQNDKLNDASVVLQILNQVPELKRKDALYRQKVNADYRIANKNYGEALENINNAIGLEKKRRSKIRLYYIKAQLLQRLGNSNEAIAAYRYVVKKSQDYDLAFNAGISQATAVEGSANSFSVKKDLQKLLKDEKNEEYRDQIYYALAEISFTEREYAEAVENLQLSIKASINNDRQKGKSFYRLAKYYFQEKLYQQASVYYDSTLSILPNTHPEYPEVKTKSKNLQELVVHLNLIDKNDSLLALGNLAPEDLDKRLGEIIQSERDRLIREQREKEIQAQKALNAKGNNKGKSGSWYFYNPKTKQQGYKEFKEKWGDRDLRDNWRQGNSSAAGFSAANPTENSEGEDTEGEIAGLPDYGKLRKDIPQSEAEKQKLIQATKNSLYQSGLVYKENFEDINNAIEAFENLLSRYDTTTYRLPAYYQLYRLYLIKENQSEKEFFSFDSKSSSFYYKDLILYEYPESEFARLINNPKSVKTDKVGNKEANSLYNKAYLSYRLDSLDLSMKFCLQALKDYPGSKLEPKFYLLKARIHGHQKNLNDYQATLTLLSTKFASTEEGKEAARLLAIFKKFLANTTKKENTANSGKEEADKSAKGLEVAAPGISYLDNPSSPHFYILVIPDGSMNSNRAKIEVSNFNSRFFPNKKMDISITFISNELPILIVKGLENKEDALKYHQAFVNDKGELRVIARNDLKSFSISQENFKTLFVSKQIDEYLEFFEKNYK